jgi:serine/threonine protein kinase
MFGRPMTSVRPQPLAEGRFQLLEVIGEGGMATVYRAFDQRLQRPRAIKILSPAFSQRPALRRRFLSEAQTMANLENARVVRVFDMGEDGDRVYIVMELVEGGSLVDRVGVHGPLPPRMAARVTVELCEAIHAAHEASVIHRDIKPHNILLTRAGEIRITDFGIAQVQTDDRAGMTRTGAVLGTWGFMAPEQKSNAKSVDARADIYSIGGTLWSLLKNDTPPELFISEPEPEWYEGVPEPLAEVIRQATRYRREERYPSARAMSDALRAVMDLLPEDPAGTPGLVALAPDRQNNADVLDTLAQLDVESHPLEGRAQGTMVPDLGRQTIDRSPTPPPAGDRPPRARSTRPSDGPTRLLPFLAVAVTLGVAALVIWKLQPDTPPPALPLPPTPAAVRPPPTEPAPSEPPLPPEPAAPVAPAAPVEAVVASPPGPVPAPDRAPATPSPKAVPPGPATPVAVEPAAPTPSPEPPVVVTAEVKATAPAAAKLTTTGPATASPGGTVTVSASIAGRYTLKLYYRGSSGAFQNKHMTAAGGNGYSASFKIDETMADGAYYFVAATDSDGKTVRDGSPTSPIRVAVQ